MSENRFNDALEFVDAHKVDDGVNTNEIAKNVENVSASLERTDNAAVPTQFGKAMEAVKLAVLDAAAEEDQEFIDKVKRTLKAAAVKNTEVEEKQADFEKQKVDFASEILQTEQQKNVHRSVEDKWKNRERSRQYHYNGCKPIMMSVGITEPLNLPLLYLLVLVLTPFFLLSKLIAGTIGTMIAGASDSDRPKSVKGFLWTLIAIMSVIVIVSLVYLFLKWQSII